VVTADWQRCSVRGCRSKRLREPEHRQVWWWVCPAHETYSYAMPTDTTGADE
jgi:hypothetical protein